MVPELPEGVGPIAVLDPLAGVVAHLAAQVGVRCQTADRFRKIIHIQRSGDESFDAIRDEFSWTALIGNNTR